MSDRSDNLLYCDRTLYHWVTHRVLLKGNETLVCLATSRIVGSEWSGWTISRGPESPGGLQPKLTQKTNIGLGIPHCSLSMGPRGSCYAYGNILRCIYCNGMILVFGLLKWFDGFYFCQMIGLQNNIAYICGYVSLEVAWKVCKIDFKLLVVNYIFLNQIQIGL